MRSTSSASSPGGACFGRDGSKDSSSYSNEQTLSFRKTLFLVKLQSNHNNLGGVQKGVGNNYMVFFTCEKVTVAMATL